MLKVTRKRGFVSTEHICKRPYVPGTILKSECPKCSKVWLMDLNKEYVDQYPASGQALEVTAECDSCWHVWCPGKVAYVLRVELCG